MTIGLEGFLAEHAGADTRRQNVAETITALAGAIITLSRLVARVPFDAAMARLPAHEIKNAGGDSQRGIDVEANDAFVDRLAMVRSVACLASEEMDRAMSLHPDGWPWRSIRWMARPIWRPTARPVPSSPFYRRWPRPPRALPSLAPR